MSIHKQIGDFFIETWDPYPIWIMIRHGDQELKFSHRELADLEYAIQCARRDVSEQIGAEGKTSDSGKP